MHHILYRSKAKQGVKQILAATYHANLLRKRNDSLALVQELGKTSFPAHLKHHSNTRIVSIVGEICSTSDECHNVWMPELVHNTKLQKGLPHGLLQRLSIRSLAHFLDSYRLCMCMEMSLVTTMRIDMGQHRKIGRGPAYRAMVDCAIYSSKGSFVQKHSFL